MSTAGEMVAFQQPEEKEETPQELFANDINEVMESMALDEIQTVNRPSAYRARFPIGRRFP